MASIHGLQHLQSLWPSHFSNYYPIRPQYKKVKALAVFLGMTASNFSTIWNGRQPFQRKHIVRIAVRYQLSPQDVWDIFFLADAEAIKKEAREA